VIESGHRIPERGFERLVTPVASIRTGNEFIAFPRSAKRIKAKSVIAWLFDCFVSAAVHGAKEDTELFKSAFGNIQKHFDIRRVHELDSADAEKPTAATEDSDLDATPK
jgi:hypothetical protein